jgi:hypothetical protein
MFHFAGQAGSGPLMSNVRPHETTAHMELRTPTALLVAIAALLTPFVVWQFVDEGLTFTKSRLPTLVGAESVHIQVVAFWARYEESQRTYSVLAVSPGSSSFHRVVVLYGPDRKPYDARLLVNF